MKIPTALIALTLTAIEAQDIPQNICKAKQ